VARLDSRQIDDEQGWSLPVNASGQPIFYIENAEKRLEKAGATFTLHIPKLAINRGEFVAFVGESGCGKTTLLDLLGLVSQPTSATRFEVDFNNGSQESISAATESRLAEIRRRHVGYVLQTGGLLPFLSVGENILLVRRANNLGNPEEAKKIARQLGIIEQWSKKPAFLSGGQRQRVAIARALAHSPALLLADEPTGAVDRVTAREIRALLTEAARARHATVIIVTHDEPLVAGVTDRVFTFRVAKPAPDRVESTLFETSWSERNQISGVL
jgi:putative ABC transport system ATP-binding protein